MLLQTQHDSKISQRLIKELADVADRFVRELDSDLACVNELSGHVERYRGKMLRPTLMLVSAMAIRPQEESSTDAHRVVATVVEMVHMATLVHDDILDEADLRRRGATVNHLYGNEAAVMLGDYLISHAYHLCSSLARQDISRAIAAVTNTICEGELLQLNNRNNWRLDEDTYFDIIRRKTASLCGVCCSLSGKLYDADERVVAALDEYGNKLGVAFQIVDDLLDLTGDQDTVGKTLGRDLEKGKLTLPVIRALRASDGEVCEKLLAALADRKVEQVRQAVMDAAAVESSRETASQLIEAAKASLKAVLDDSPARALLLSMADAVLSREF